MKCIHNLSNAGIQFTDSITVTKIQSLHNRLIHSFLCIHHISMAVIMQPPCESAFCGLRISLSWDCYLLQRTCIYHITCLPDGTGTSLVAACLNGSQLQLHTYMLGSYVHDYCHRCLHQHRHSAIIFITARR